MKKLFILMLFLPAISIAETHMMQGDAAGGGLSGTYPNPTINTSMLGSGSSNYIQNSLTPSTTSQTFSVMTGSVTGQFIFAGNKMPITQSSGLNQVVFCNNGVCSFGDAPGFSMPDGTAFTTLVTSMNPVGGVYNDSLTALGSTAAGAFRMTPNRAEHVSLRDSQGVALGTGTANPIYVYQTNPSTVSITGLPAITTVTFNGIGQPVTSTYTVIVASNIYNNTLSAATTGLTILSADENQRLLVTGIPRGQIKQATATLTTNTETVFISSGATGIFDDLCGCVFSNTSATAVRIDLRGQTGAGTINMAFYIPAGDTRGFWPGCQNPFVQLVPAAQWSLQLSASVTDVRATCQYIPLK